MNPVNWHFETDLEYLTTIPIHYLDLHTHVTKTRITETLSFRIANGCLIWQIHIQSFRSISIITSLCQRTGIIIIPSFSPTLQYPISQTTHFFLLIPFIINHSIIHRLMDNWFPNRNCLILCFHWFHFICWQGIILSILVVWNQWINGRGERELKQQQQQ